MVRWLIAGWLLLLGTTTASAQQGLWAVYHEAGTSVRCRGFTAEAEKLWKTALEAAVKDGPKALYQTSTLDNLVGLYIEQSRMADAEGTLKKILEVTETALAADAKNAQEGKDARDVPAVANCCAKLIDFYQQLFANRDADAEPYLRRVLAIQSKEANLATVYGPGLALFQCLLYQNKLADAETTIRWCLDVANRNPGPLQVNAQAACLHGLAMVFYKRKQDAQAEAAYMQALAGLEKAFGPDDPKLIWTLYHIGNFHHALLGNPAKSEFFYMRAMAIAAKSKIASDGQTSQILLALGQINYVRRGPGSQRYFDNALELADKLPADASAADQLGVAAIRLQIARLYMDQGRFPDAEAQCKKAFHQVEEVKGTPQRELGHCYRSQADCAIAQNKLAEAKTHAMKAMEVDEKCFGPNHGFVALDLCRLARLARLANQDAEAERLCQQALPIAQREMGITRPEVREVVDEYEAVLRKTNRVAEAQQLEARAVNELKLPQAAGVQAPVTATAPTLTVPAAPPAPQPVRQN